MERELFWKIRERLLGLNAPRRGRCRFSDAVIVLVFFWACLNDRSVSWACVPGNWSGRWRPRRLPSQSRMSRRLRTASVRALIGELEEQVLRAGRQAPLACALDAKPLPVGPHSHDRQARWGRGAGSRAKGYKLHVLLSLSGTVMAWRLTPMNGDEREMGRRLLRQARCAGYHLADGNFDANAVHDEAARYGGQLVAPRRNGPGTGLGHRRQSPARLRCIELLENGLSPFGRQLHALRAAIERKFGYLASTGGLLTALPAWVRGHTRVRMWVQAKLIIADLRTSLRRRNTSAA